MPTSHVFPLSFSCDSLAACADRLVETFGFYIDSQDLPRLNLSPERLELLTKEFKPLWVNFNDEEWLRRSLAGKQQGIIKACQPKPGLRIIDATAGWGRDAAILTYCGANVLMLERHPVMAALLQDALMRFKPSAKQGQLSLLYSNAVDYLQALSDQDFPDLIYIDPMHPERQKTALVKKDMQILQHLIGPDKDAQSLIQLAKNRAKKRVVVKWPQYEPALLPAQRSISGKTVRFDIYSINSPHHDLKSSS